jgi:hypothetical protein
VIKLLFAVRAKPGLTRAQVLHHLRHNHAPLVKAAVTNRRQQRTYIQNHALEAPAAVNATLDRDWIIESWRDETVIRTEPPVAPDAIIVREDEGRFPDQSTLLTLQVEEQPVWYATDNETFAEAPVKVFTYYRRAPGMSADDFEKSVVPLSEILASNEAFRREVRSYIRNRSQPGAGPPPIPTPTPFAAKNPPYDAVDVYRFRDLEAVRRLFEDSEFRAALSAFEAGLFDPEAIFRLVTEENLVFDDAMVDPASRAENAAIDAATSRKSSQRH